MSHEAVFIALCFATGVIAAPVGYFLGWLHDYLTRNRTSR